MERAPGEPAHYFIADNIVFGCELWVVWEENFDIEGKVPVAPANYEFSNYEWVQEFIMCAHIRNLETQEKVAIVTGNYELRLEFIICAPGIIRIHIRNSVFVMRSIN